MKTPSAFDYEEQKASLLSMLKNEVMQTLGGGPLIQSKPTMADTHIQQIRAVMPDTNTNISNQRPGGQQVSIHGQGSVGISGFGQSSDQLNLLPQTSEKLTLGLEGTNTTIGH